LRCDTSLAKHNKAIAKFACKYISPVKDEYSEKFCEGENCDNCIVDKFNGYVSRNSLAKALTMCNKSIFWYSKAKIITTDMLRLWEIGNVKPPLEYIILLTDICSLKIDDIVFYKL